MKATIKITKFLVIVILLISIDLALRYAVEELDIFSVKPRSVPNYNNKHLENIFYWIPYITVFMGWAYLLVILAYHETIKKFAVLNSIARVLIAIGVCFLGYIIY